LSNIAFTNLFIQGFFVKTFQGPREFTFETALDGLKYEEDLKKEHLPELFVRSCLTWIIIIMITITIIMIIMIMITKPKTNITN